MTTLTNHFERVRAKPHHIRRQIAFTVATGTTILVGLVWLIGGLATSSFALGGDSFFGSGVAAGSDTQPKDSSTLLGAAAAAFPHAISPQIQIVDVGKGAGEGNAKDAEPTILPF